MSGIDQINSQSLSFLEGMYEDYLKDPASIPDVWRAYFASMEQGNGGGAKGVGPSLHAASIFNPPGGNNGAPAKVVRDAGPPVTEGTSTIVRDVATLQEKVERMVRAYRVRAHRVAQYDPLGLVKANIPELDLSYYGLSEADLDRRIYACSLKGPPPHTVRDVVDRVRNTYTRSIGVQYMHIDDISVQNWLQERMEACENHLELSREEQIWIFKRLNDATTFEEFIQKKYQGAKSFSLEGGETLIPMLDLLIEVAGEQKIEQVILAMAHRGRLNVLCNILGKTPREIFYEFEDFNLDDGPGYADVKYHLGYSNDRMTKAGQNVHLSLCFNSSHLEFVNPIALGRLRAKQDRFGDTRFERGLCVILHGDAAMPGEGVVQETFNLSQLQAYHTGGSIHLVLNNQIGFTTEPAQNRSSPYCTDVAKMLQIPIFHVNGEDPAAVAQVVRLAMDFRRAFKRDVVIDMLCYRLRGHNEGDEPSFTQPVMYKAIRARKSVRESYLENLLKHGDVTREEAQHIMAQPNKYLEDELAAAKHADHVFKLQSFGGVWQGYAGGPESAAPRVETGVEKAKLGGLMETLGTAPQGFNVHPKLVRFLEARREMGKGTKPLDWAAGESLAFASLSAEQYRLRMTGQDVERGTFSQRHLVLHDYETNDRYMPLGNLRVKQGPISIHNSALSEVAVLGFEYGYSLDTPDGLTIWEAQFGDFANVAQIIIDQFIASGEVKWRRLSGLVMLLPHGLEGMGPEHSSGRIERYLNLCAGDNMQVVNLTTPAQYYHCLRRQALRKWLKPLIIFTPKSLLRHPKAVSPLDDFTTGTAFHKLIHDDKGIKKPSRIVLCSGKIYYDLAAMREEKKCDDVAIIRVEQLYPFPAEALDRALEAYPSGTPAYWVQEEPENMGAWTHMRLNFGETEQGRIRLHCIARPASSSPATGSHRRHDKEQHELVVRALGIS